MALELERLEATRRPDLGGRLDRIPHIRNRWIPFSLGRGWADPENGTRVAPRHPAPRCAGVAHAHHIRKRTIGFVVAIRAAAARGKRSRAAACGLCPARKGTRLAIAV